MGDPDELTRLPGLNARNVPILSVTENADQPLLKRRAGDFRRQREADPLNMLATTSILLVLAIFDAACACLMMKAVVIKGDAVVCASVVMWD